MGDKSHIEWTDATWNPVTGCTKVSQGCKNCYAKHQAWPRLAASRGTVYFGREFEDVQTHDQRLEQPLRWTKPRRIFVNSMSDLFHERVSFRFIDKVFAVMLMAPQHAFQVLTKRPERMREYMAGRDLLQPVTAAAAIMPKREINSMDWPPANVWLGVSVEDQETADERIPLLLQTPAAVRWISAEPLLQRIDLMMLHHEAMTNIDTLAGRYGVRLPLRGECAKLDWVVVGGESGREVRPMHPNWVRTMRDQCVAARVPFLFKQWGEWVPADRAMWDGVTQYKRPELEPDRVHWLWPDGRHEPVGGGNIRDGDASVLVYRIGKRLAGRTIDGRTWDEYPA